MNLIENFKKKWLEKSKDYTNNPEKIKTLLGKVTKLFSKDGLKDVLEDLKYIVSYVKDIANGNYKDYDVKNFALSIAVIIYVVSPLDVIPDFLPAGFIDDASLIAWAVKLLHTELEKYKQWKSSK